MILIWINCSNIITRGDTSDQTGNTYCAGKRCLPIGFYGSGVRDYIHVNDLIDAHLLALDHLQRQDGVEIFNCGYGRGYSVLEVIAATERVSDKALQVIMADRRDGDPAELVASSDRIRKILGWTPKRDHLDHIINTALTWENTLP